MLLRFVLPRAACRGVRRPGGQFPPPALPCHGGRRRCGVWPSAVMLTAPTMRLCFARNAIAGCPQHAHAVGQSARLRDSAGVDATASSAELPRGPASGAFTSPRQSHSRSVQRHGLISVCHRTAGQQRSSGYRVGQRSDASGNIRRPRTKVIDRHLAAADARTACAGICSLPARR